MILPFLWKVSFHTEKKEKTPWKQHRWTERFIIHCEVHQRGGEISLTGGIYEFIKMNFIKRMNFIIYKEKLTDLENQLMIIWKKYIGVVGH